MGPIGSDLVAASRHNKRALALALGATLAVVPTGAVLCQKDEAQNRSWGSAMVGAAILGVGGVALWYRKRGASTMYTAASETKDEDPKTDIKGVHVDTQAAALYSQGVALWKEGGSAKLQKAADLMIRAAESGHAPAQRTLGWYYRHGIGVKRDYNESARRYQQAVDQNDAQAQYELSVLYMSALGVKYKPKEARRLAGLAAAQGYEAATNALEGRDPRHEAVLQRAADPNTGMPKRVADDGIDVVEATPRNQPGTGNRTANQRSVL